MSAVSPAIEVSHLYTRFGNAVVHDDVSLNVRCGEIFALAGGSGCGKSTLLREIIKLQRPVSGSIHVFGHDIHNMGTNAAASLLRRVGVMFERGALFSALTVAENIAMPMNEYTNLSKGIIEELVALKVFLVGLPASAMNKYPTELSGGMRKRAALARAIALDPELLILDEPTAGLDPLSASNLDELVLHLKESFGLTVLMITHDIDLLWGVADRVAILGEGHVLGEGTMEELSKSAHPMVREYFHGPRGRAVGEKLWNRK